MGAMSWVDAERIIESEVRRFIGTLPGYDRDDLRQECRMVVARALERVQARHSTAKGYVRTACKNRLANLLRDSMTAGRCPHDAWGRPRPGLLLGEEGLTTSVVDANIENVVADRQAVRYLQMTLDPRDWQQLEEAFVDGALAARSGLGLEEARERALSILGRIGYRVRRESEDETMSNPQIPETPVEELPSCHANGAKPQGYDANEIECHQCPDKFTCLPAAIEKQLVPLRLSADREVEAVVEGHLDFMGAVARMKRRLARMKAGEAIPEEERHDWEGIVPGAAAPVEPAEPEQAPVAAASPAPEPEAAPAPEAAAEPTEAPTASAEPKDKRNGKGRKPNGKATKPVEPEPAAAKPSEAPKPSEAQKPETFTMRAVATSASHAEVYVGERKIARIEKTDSGWGWFGVTGGVESDQWFGTYAATTKDLASRIEAEARAKGATLELDESLRKMPAPPASEAPKAAKKAPKKTKAPKVKSESEEGGNGRSAPDYWPKMRDGRPYPVPRALPEEEMVKKLEEAQAKLGANIELDYGMQIVRRTRAGDVIAVIRPNGFEYTITDPKLVEQARLDSPTQLFGSLSSVAMWGEGRLRTGNDFFNLAKHNCTEIRSADNRIIDRRGGVPG